jgi:hypothetical protein
MTTIVEASDLPQVGVEAILIGSLPARSIDPKLKDGRIASVNSPRSIAAEQFSN